MRSLRSFARAASGNGYFEPTLGSYFQRDHFQPGGFRRRRYALAREIAIRARGHVKRTGGSRVARRSDQFVDDRPQHAFTRIDVDSVAREILAVFVAYEDSRHDGAREAGGDDAVQESSRACVIVDAPRRAVAERAPVALVDLYAVRP